MAKVNVVTALKTQTVEKVIKVPETVPDLNQVSITLDLNRAEAAQLMELCDHVGGLASRSIRGIFTDRKDSIRRQLADRGLTPHDGSVTGGIYCNNIEGVE